MIRTAKADRRFIVAASLSWSLALFVTFWDLAILQAGRFRLGPLTLIGFAICSAGVLVRLAARRTLGIHFTHGLHLVPGHRLVTHGIYGYIRHPAYAGAILFYFGTPLVFNSAIGCLAMVPLVPCILYRVSAEEKMLLEAFGDEYRGYARNTKKLVPFLF